MNYWRFWSWFWWGVAVWSLLRHEFVEGLVCYGLSLQCKILSRSAEPQPAEHK